jgi:hypothetical protein
MNTITESAIEVLTDEIKDCQSLEEITELGIKLNDLIKKARQQYQLIKIAEGQPAPVETPVDPVTPLASVIHDGTYTVAFEDGKHVTLKFKTSKGKQWVGYLNGPDNWTNYQSFGWVEDGKLVMFAKYRGQLNRQQGAVSRLLKGNDAQLAGLKSYGMASGKCGICGRKLTTPESIERGIGPECITKL